MEHRAIAKTFYLSNIRVDALVHLATSGTQGALHNTVEDHFKNEWDEIWAAIGLKAPEDEDADAIACTLVDHNHLGFLVNVATPVPKNITETGYSYSWSNYTSKWFYGEDLEAVYETAMEWQAEYMAKQRAKQIA